MKILIFDETICRSIRGKQGEIKKFQEKYKFDSIKLPCKQKKKILSQVWKDNDNMMTNGYWVSSCTGDVGGPLRQFKFSKKHKPCDAKGNILEIPKLESKNQISKDFDEPKSKINSCNFELSREVIQTYSLFLPDIGRVTKEKKICLRRI